MKSKLLSPLTVIITASLLVTLSLGFRQSLGVYTAPFDEISDAGRQMFGLAIAVQNLLWGIAAPIFGGLADRYGAHKSALIGAILYSMGLFFMQDASLTNLFSGQILIGLGLGACGMSTALGAVSKISTPEKRSMLLGVVSAAGSLGQFLLVPIAGQLLMEFGWASSLLILSMIATIMIPLSYGLKGSHIRQPEKGNHFSTKEAISQAFNHRDYLLLMAGFFVCGFQVVFVATHLIAYLVEHHISSEIASWSLALVGLFNIFGTLLCGYLGGKYRKKVILTWFYLLRSLVIALFLILPLTPITAIGFGALIGFLWLGTVPLTSGLVIYFFGVRYVTLIYGIIFFSHQLGSFLGAWLGGWAYENFQSYSIVWGLAILFGIISAALHHPIRESAPKVEIKSESIT